MEKFEVRKYDSETMAFTTQHMTIKEIVERPFGINMEDIAVTLLNAEREKLGLEKVKTKHGD